MKVAQHQTVKIPSKTQFLARVNDYAPSNLRKTTNGFDSTMTSTAYRTFNNPSTNQENSTLALKNSRSASVKERPKTAKPTTVTKGQEKKKRAASAKPKTGPKRQKTSSAVSGSVNSLRSEGSIPSQNNLASREDESATENEPTHKKGSKSVSNERPNLPGNYEVPNYLYKGLFQNNYMMGDTIQVKDQDYNQVTYQKDYRDYEQEYKIHREAKGQENLDDYNYLDKKLALYKLLDDENMESKKQSRKLINLTETINGSHALLNPNYQPEDVAFERLPGYIPGKRTISERERAAMFIQRVVRGIMTRQRIKKVKENLKKHLKGDLDADPYEIEFYDLNVPAFKKLIESQEGPLQPTKTAAQKADEYDPEKKLLTNTFYSLIRSPFFPEDPMDYYVLGETKDDQFAAFPKLIYEEQERRSKDVMLERKYNYLFEKPLMKDYKTDDKSVIKNFLKSNLASITNADLKVDKFKIEYKSPVKAKTKPVLSFSAKSPRSAEVNKPKKFSHMASGAKDEIHTEISEDYGDDFEQDSAIKESIQESYDMRNSVIKESIPYSYGDSKNNKSIINESIQESIESNSPIGKITKKMSNKSISEEIEATNSRRFDRNASFKSIEEEIPGSESTSPRHKKGQLKKVRSMEDEIEEDIPAKDSYGDEEFESLEESIQESIEKFQNSRSNSKMDKLNIKEVSTPSPQKKVEQPSKPSFTSSKPALFKPKEEKKEEKSAPLSQTMPASVQKQKPVEAATKPLSQTIAAAPRYEEREPVGYAGYDEYESRRTFARTEFATTSATKTAEVLFANFQKELEKMVYVDNLSKKVHTLESTIENIYNQKEINILHSLQNKVAGAPTSSLQPHSALTPSELENNSLVYLMKKYNTLERSIGSISNQLNFLINNFTGGAPVPGQSLAATGLKAPAARKPRPIIPVRKSQNVRIKDEASLKPAAQQVKEQGKENVVKPKEQIKEVIKPKEVSPVKQKEVSPIKPQVKEGPKELPKPVSIKEDKPKPKFQFKFSEPKIQDKEEEEIEEIVEEEVPELPVNVPVKPVNVVKAQEKPKPVAVEEAKKLPDLTKPVPSMTKSAKFGKWQESSSESVIDEAESKRAKTPEDEEDFSVKEYSDTSDKPVHRVLPSAVPKAEEKKEITMPLTLPSKLQPVKKPDSPKKIQDESESIIDEVLDIPVEDIDEPSTHRNVKGKEATKAKAEDDDYYDDEFEELSYHSEPKEEKPAPVVQKSPKVEKRVVPEVSPIPEKSVSSDVEASQDLSIISWQETMATAEAAMAQKAEAQKAKVQEKKVEDVTNAVMQSILQDLSKDLFPKRNFAQIEEVKSKLKHVHIAEQQIFNVHQETPEMAQAAAEKLNQSQVKEEDVKHNKYTDNIKKELEVLTNKMSQAKKSQIIAITINHINFSDPATKFTIFDKNPVKDESIADAYNEIFLKLFRSEFRKLNNEFATTKDVEKTMMIKMDNLINKSKDILIKKIGQAHSETEEYQKLSKRFDDMYETLRHKKMVGEENDFFEEEEDVKRLMEEENNKMKESVADQVMETLFEEAVQDLINLGKSRGNKKRY